MVEESTAARMIRAQCRHRPPLVWLAEVPFQGHPHRQAHLARYLSDRFDVLYVEPPPPLTLPALNTSTYLGVRVAQVAPLLNARPALLRWGLAHSSGRKLAGWLARLQLWHAFRVGLSHHRRERPIVVCSNVFLCQAAGALARGRLVVDICDDPRYFPGEPSWTAEALRTAVLKARVVTTSSRALQAEFREFGGRQVELVPNGVHAVYLNNDRAASPPPIGAPVGFVGYLGPWIDFELLGTLARALPEVRLRLIGPIDPSVSGQASALASLPNVCFEGPVPESAVPGALSTISVGLIPFRRTPYTWAVNPNKLYEYAAWNLPIVATPFSPDVKHFAPDVDVCETTEEFVAKVRDRVTGAGRRSTRWIAESHTWSAVGAQFATLVEQVSREVRPVGLRR